MRLQTIGRFAFASLLLLASSATAQVAYNFQSPDQISLSTAPVSLTMDGIAANGYGQWTTSSATADAHLLSNKLTGSSADNPQAGILASKGFTYYNTTGTGLDVYPVSDVMKVTSNLKGNVRYVWINDPTARNNFYVEGFNPGTSGIDIRFATLPADPSIVKASVATGVAIALPTGHKLVAVGNETNPLDRFDIAMDAQYVYIVWEEAAVGPTYSIWAMVCDMSGTVVVPATQVTTVTGTGSTGRRPTVAVDVRNSGSTVAPFDVSYIDQIPGGNVIWRQWIPGSSSFTTASTIPNQFINPVSGLSDTWSNPQHARILAASQAGVTPSAGNQRAVYVIADKSGLNLFLDRIVSHAPQIPNEYCDGLFNSSHAVPVGTAFLPVLNDPLWAFANPYEGANAGSILPTSTFTEFHSMYRLDRSSIMPTGSQGVRPLMIVRTSDVTHGYCLNKNGGAFFDDPVINSTTGAMQYCGAVNQMGVHAHWISANTHFYRRDKREFDQNIEENTLLTAECDFGNTTSGVGSPTATVLSNTLLSLYSDPTFSGVSYTGFGQMKFDAGATLNIGNSSNTGADWITAGRYNLIFASSGSNSYIVVNPDNNMDFYGFPNSSNPPADVTGQGSITVTGSGETTAPTAAGDVYPKIVAHPAIVNIHGGALFPVSGDERSNVSLSSTNGRFNFPMETNVITGAANATGQLQLYGDATFNDCQIWTTNNLTASTPLSQNNPIVIQIGSNVTESNYTSATHSTVTFASCWMRAGLDGSGNVIGHGLIVLTDGSSGSPLPSALTITGGLIDGFSIDNSTADEYPSTLVRDLRWPVSISFATFDDIRQWAVHLTESQNYIDRTAPSYSITVSNCYFQTYSNLANQPDPNGILIEEAYGTSDALRESLTVTSNTFTSGTNSLYPEPSGGIAAAIHFSDATGDIGSNNVTTDITTGSKYQRGIWNESSLTSSTHETVSLICSNACSGLKNGGATGLSTDNFGGYAKLNNFTHCQTGHLSGVTDVGHVIFSSYTNSAGSGFEAENDSKIDMSGVHHNTDGTPNADDVAAFNVLTGNNSGGAAISLNGSSKIFLGNAWAAGCASPPSWTKFGENDIEGVPDVASINAVTICDVSNNYWGGSIFTASSNVSYTDPSDVSAKPTIPSVYCSGGLTAKRRGNTSLTLFMQDTTNNWCGRLFAFGITAAGNSMWESSYDSLRLFVQVCPLYINSWDAFSYMGTAVSQWLEGGKQRWPNYLAFLKKVLYYNPDTNWYCEDVVEMFNAIQSDSLILDQGMKQAVASYIIQHDRCPELTSAFVTYYNTASKWRRYYWGIDSARDSLTTPYDSTLPSLQDLGLEVLMGPQNGVAAPTGTPGKAVLLVARVQDNPFDNALDVSFDMGRTALVTMELRDVLGRSISIPNTKYQLENTGTHSSHIPLPDLPPGAYYLRIITDLGDTKTLKVVKR